ncbi:MAG: PatB family C-S lyase [Oceanospirillaceae bacterium]
MPVIDFDQPINRLNTDSTKWERYSDQSILPMWIADTDFKAPSAITDALKERIEHGVFGYTCVPAELTQTVIERMQRLYGWKVKEDWIVWLPGLVCALNLACRTAGPTGGTALTPTPIYPPFVSAAHLSDLQVSQVPMILNGDRWIIDFSALEQRITTDTKILLFCNPHNPGGTVYSLEELEILAEIVVKHKLILCSDEVHCDLILDKQLRHIPIASLNDEIAKRCITLMAPSKTFNIAGLACSFAIIADVEMRKKFNRVRNGIVPSANLLGYTATHAAYSQGEQWLAAQLEYLRHNHDYLMREINAIPGLKMLPNQATYLAWIDVSAAKLENPALFFEEAGVGLSPGRDFGDNNYVRMNFGCTKSLVEEAVNRMRSALLKHLSV